MQSYSVIPEDVDLSFLLAADYLTVVNLSSTIRRFSKYTQSVDFWRQKTYHDFGTRRNFDDSLQEIKIPSKVYLRIAAYNSQPIPGVEDIRSSDELGFNIGSQGNIKTIDYFLEVNFPQYISYILSGLISSGREYLISNYCPAYDKDINALIGVIEGYARIGKIYPLKNFRVVSQERYYLAIIDGAILGNHSQLAISTYEKMITSFGCTNEIYFHIIHDSVSLAAAMDNDQLVEFLINDKRIPKVLSYGWDNAAIGYCRKGKLEKIQSILPQMSKDQKIFTNLVVVAVNIWWKHIVEYFLITHPDLIDWVEVINEIVANDVVELYDLLVPLIAGPRDILIYQAIENQSRVILSKLLLDEEFVPEYLIAVLKLDNWKGLAKIFIRRYSSAIINQTLASPFIGNDLTDLLLLKLIELGGTYFINVLNLAIENGLPYCLPIILSRVSGEAINNALLRSIQDPNLTVINEILRANPTNIDEAIELAGNNPPLVELLESYNIS